MVATLPVGGTGVDVSRHKGTVEHLDGAKLRNWLRVPAGLALPRWARKRLAPGVLAELEARAGTQLDNVVFGIVDLETTGLAAHRDRILEIGLVVRRAGRTLERYSTLIDVEIPIPAFITGLTRIDAGETIDAPSEAEALKVFGRVLRRHRVEVLVAHNAPFDRGFLERAWENHRSLPPLPSFLCSLRLARKWVRAPRYGLDVLADQLGVPKHGRHRALGDAEMTARLWDELLQRGRLHGVHTLEALQKIAGVGRSRSRGQRARMVDV